MIIECPACTSRYRIREDKLPEAGGNIKCPNCAHIFFVPRESSVSQSAAVPVVPDVADTAAGHPGPTESAAATAVATDRRWKLKNPVGLIYDFQDTEQLRAWLKSRDTFDGFNVSDDGGSSWRPVEGFEELADVTPTGKAPIGPQAAMPIGGSAPAAARPTQGSGENFPATAEQMRDAAQARLRQARRQRAPTESGIVNKPPPRIFQALKPADTPEAKQASKILLAVALVVLPLVAGIGLHAAGVIDLNNLGRGLRAPDYVPPVYRVDIDEEEEAEPEMTVEEGVRVLMNRAAAAQSRGELDLAAQTIEQATELDPADLELWCLLEPLYRELGREADVEAAAERCAEARAAEAAENAPEGDAPAEAAPAEGSGDAPATP